MNRLNWTPCRFGGTETSSGPVPLHQRKKMAAAADQINQLKQRACRNKVRAGAYVVLERGFEGLMRRIITLSDIGHDKSLV